MEVPAEASLAISSQPSLNRNFENMDLEAKDIGPDASDMVFPLSTGDSTARQDLNVNTQSSIASAQPDQIRPSGNLSSRERQDPGKIPPSGLMMSSRNSVSESKQGKS